ncbi:hypothetical protein [Sediminibacterium sp.]|uniref:hypothetical protein n=1 Tax=Sediminibacterium sp. TaxID=1917865 RepID=UPI003F72A4E2
MSEISIASRAGLLTHNLNNLLNGVADIGTASKLGIITSSLQEFLNGRANMSMASKLGLLTSDLQLLLNKVGKQGAIGLVIGILINQNSKKV